MSSLPHLRSLIIQRLTAAAEEIFALVEGAFVEYEEEVDRQRRLLEIVWKPNVVLQRLDPPQQIVCKEEEVLTEQQLCNQERNSSLDQEEPESLQIKKKEETGTSQEQEPLELKQEADTSMLTPDNEQSDHMEPEPDCDHQLLPPVAESQDQTVHMRNITGEKPHICDICTKRFAHKRGLIRHMRTHKVERPFSCETCGKCFRKSSHLGEHKITHTGKKPYICLLCNKCFARKDRFIGHQRTHKGKKSHICHICNQHFSCKSTLDEHVRTHAGEKPVFATSQADKSGDAAVSVTDDL